MKSANLNLRTYQTDVASRVLDTWLCHKYVLVQMPTGTGKTHVLASIVNKNLRMRNEESKGLWIVAHRRELV